MTIRLVEVSEKINRCLAERETFTDSLGSVIDKPLGPEAEKDNLTRQILQTEYLSRCLAPCNECTGSYFSEVLNKQFICNCSCHHQLKPQ